MKATTLAVGTEVVDGQITDRNSAWLSERSVLAGLEMIEHRAVPDDRERIAQALRELSDKSDLLFVTGGLGPTSDDFTRELIAEVYSLPLEYDEASWQKIVKRFEARGVQAKPIQRQQCYFPKTARILENPMGTANAFYLHLDWKGRSLEVFVLPGPPAEIAAVWEAHLAAHVASLVPIQEQEDLHLWRTLGLGEGDIAEKTEEAIIGSGLRVGYRAHLPYVEVKLWVPRAHPAPEVVARVEEALGPWLISRGKNDVALCVVKSVYEGHDVAIIDRVTGGYVQQRLSECLSQFRRENPGRDSKGSLRITTTLVSQTHDEAVSSQGDAVFLALMPDEANQQWTVKMTGPESQTLAVAPTSLYNFGTERGHKYMAEKMFHVLSSLAPFARHQEG